ncbi:MAG: NAD(P)/FAD-dependent oxidoreductase [Chloroflexi bacterium]|nr:NAD(P)/FAD-dependent oxidoreductase [Chloroflexota bacterium]MBM4453311.1 NAD(P)/FAD-dependent oxidoreductase [Chloroflexota bacterium]
MSQNRIIVIGAGASGMMAAGRAAELGAEVLLLEKTEQPGKKILISGKTRCNLTNARPLDDFIAMYGPNGRFLRSAFHRFFRDNLLALLKRYGVVTRAESDGRIFPASDNAQDIVNALQHYMSDHNVQIETGTKVTSIQAEDSQVTGIQTEQKAYPAKAVILATGGASFPGTGSSGDGYRLAAPLGHTIIKLRPSLVPLAVQEAELAQSMRGLSLSNVRLTAYQCSADQIDDFPAPTANSGRGAGRKPRHPVIESRLGNLMMTHFGVGGPTVLQISLAIVDALETSPVSIAIDLLPDRTQKQLDEQLQRDFDRHGRRTYKRILAELLQPKMIQPFLQISSIPPEKQAHQITAEERKRLVKLLKSLRFNIKEPLPLASAMVTAGGVSLKEINPRTMESLLIKRLYLCGEVIDIDAETGGYNLQAAFSTGYVAGEQAAATAKSIQ